MKDNSKSLLTLPLFSLSTLSKMASNDIFYKLSGDNVGKNGLMRSKILMNGTSDVHSNAARRKLASGILG